MNRIMTVVSTALTPLGFQSRIIEEMTFVEYLRSLIEEFHNHRLSPWDYADYLSKIFTLILKEKSGIRLGILRTSGEDLFLELDEYVHNYIPESVAHPVNLKPEFFPVSGRDLVLGEVTDEEKVIFLESIRVALNAIDLKDASERPTAETWQRAIAKGLTPVSHMYWVIFWASVIWRFPEIYSQLKIGELDLEVREGWKIVACRPSHVVSVV